MQSENINEDEVGNPFGHVSNNVMWAALLALFFELSVCYIFGGLFAPPVWKVYAPHIWEPDRPIPLLGWTIKGFYFISGFVFTWFILVQIIIGVICHMKKSQPKIYALIRRVIKRIERQNQPK